MAAATGSMNNVQCNIAENEKDSKESKQQQQEPSSKFSELPQNIFGSRSTSFNGRQIGIMGYGVLKALDNHKFILFIT